MYTEEMRLTIIDALKQQPTSIIVADTLRWFTLRDKPGLLRQPLIDELEEQIVEQLSEASSIDTLRDIVRGGYNGLHDMTDSCLMEMADFHHIDIQRFMAGDEHGMAALLAADWDAATTPETPAMLYPPPYVITCDLGDGEGLQFWEGGEWGERRMAAEYGSLENAREARRVAMDATPDVRVSLPIFNIVSLPNLDIVPEEVVMQTYRHEAAF